MYQSIVLRNLSINKDRSKIPKVKKAVIQIYEVPVHQP